MARLRRAEAWTLVVLAVLAGGLLAVAAPARATSPAPAEGEAAPAGGGALRVVAEPSRLVLGRDAGADLWIRTPPEVAEISVTASAGRIESVRRLPTGGFAARFKPPAECFPQVAIVAVTARGAAGPLDGWLAIPLSGQGDARVHASPGEPVTLRIGDRTFGPGITGEDGVAVIPVVVPPGVREAHHGFRPVDLHVPETALVHAVAHGAAVQADRTEQVRVVAYVVAPHGAARRGDVPVLEPSRGSVAVTAREAGAFEVVWTLPPGAAGEERLAVRLAGAPASKAVVRVGALPGRAVAVALSFDREAVTADGDAPREVIVTARTVDAAGNAAAAGGPLELDADAGELSRTVERAPGVFEARLAVPPRFGNRRELRVTARGGGIFGARSLSLVPGPPAAAWVERRALVADGAREASLRVVVEDRHGNAVAATPEVTAARGSVLAVAADGAGASLVRYRPPAVERRSEDRLAIRVGAVRAEGRILLLPTRGPSALLLAAGIALGRGGASGPRAALAVDRDLPLAPAGLDLSWRVEAEWASLSRSAREGAPGTVTSRAGALLTGVSVRRGVGAVTAWASGSAGAVLEASRPGGSGAALAGRLALGVGWPQRRRMPFLEASVLAADRGALPAFALSVGVRLGEGEAHGDDPDRR